MKKDITIIPNLVELEQQFEYVNSLIEQHRSSAIAKVNIEALLTNWEVGQYISQQLKSAHWGAKVVSELADYLKRMNPKRRGFGKRHLYNMVKFYDTYSTDEFNQLGKLLRLDEFVQLPIAQTEVGEIAQSVPTQLPLNEIVQSPIAQLDTPLINMPRILALSEKQKVIIEMIIADPFLSAKAISEKMSEKMSEKEGVNERTIERDIAKLKKLGVLTREGGRKEGKWVINNKYQ